MSGEPFDRVLLAAQAGAEWALAAIYRDLQPRLLRYLAAREPAEAEDLAAEVWLDVASGLGRFAGNEDGFRAWVFTIARRRLVDLRRRATVRRAAPPHALPGGERWIGNVEDEAIAALGDDAALTLISALAPDQADVVLLRVVADLSVDEVARILGKRSGAVRALQHRALRALARTISDEGVTP